MNTLPDDLINSLKTLGLTEYEAKVYSALVLFDRAEVKQIYEYLNAPKPSVYQSLKTLTDKGLVQVVNAKPAIYRATPPGIAIRHMSEAHRKAEDFALMELEELEKSRVEPEMPDILWTLYGDENVEHSIEELFEKARRSVRAILPTDRLSFLHLLHGRDIPVELITFAEERGIPGRYGLISAAVHNALKLDLSDLAPLMKYISQFPLSPDMATRFILVIVDDEEFLYIPPLPGPTRSGITSRNPFVITLVSVAFRALWDHTPPV